VKHLPTLVPDLSKQGLWDAYIECKRAAVVYQSLIRQVAKSDSKETQDRFYRALMVEAGVVA